LRSLQQQLLKIPTSVCGANQIKAGILQRKTGDLESSAPERRETLLSMPAGRPQDRFGAVAGIVINYKVRDVKAGVRNKAESDLPHRDMPTDRSANRRGKISAIAIKRKQRQDNTGSQEDSEHNEEGSPWRAPS